MKKVLNEEIISSLLSLAEPDRLEETVEVIERVETLLLSDEFSRGVTPIEWRNDATLLIAVQAVSRLRQLLEGVERSVLKQENDALRKGGKDEQ